MIRYLIKMSGRVVFHYYRLRDEKKKNYLFENRVNTTDRQLLYNTNYRGISET